MKTWALGAFLLISAGCGAFILRLEAFKMPPGERDVLWLHRGGEVFRCANTSTGPLCVLAPFTRATEAVEPLASPASPPKIEPLE